MATPAFAGKALLRGNPMEVAVLRWRHERIAHGLRRLRLTFALCLVPAGWPMRGRLSSVPANGPPSRGGSRESDGRWAVAYAPPSEAEVPADLIAAIAADPAAQGMFDVLTPQLNPPTVTGRYMSSLCRRQGALTDGSSPFAFGAVPSQGRRAVAGTTLASWINGTAVTWAGRAGDAYMPQPDAQSRPRT